MDPYGRFGEVYDQTQQIPIPELFQNNGIIIVNQNNYLDHIKNSTCMMMVYRSGCGWCQKAKVPYAQAAQKLSGGNPNKFKFLAMDSGDQQNDEFLNDQQIMSVPTFLIFKKGSKYPNEQPERYEGERQPDLFVKALEVNHTTVKMDSKTIKALSLF